MLHDIEIKVTKFKQFFIDLMTTLKYKCLTNDKTKHLKIDSLNIKKDDNYDKIISASKNIQKCKFIRNEVAVKKIYMKDTILLKKIVKQVKIVKSLSECENIVE
ncbi:3356_t:CDS:1, partial [Cetraspora pellucida]